MARPSKPVAVLEESGTKHLTKKEIEQRTAAEEALKTKTPLKELKEVKGDKKAHEEFMRVRKLLKKIDKDEGLYTAVINRYCLLCSECEELAKNKDTAAAAIEKTQAEFDSIVKENGADYDMIRDFSKQITALAKTLLSYDAAIQAKRKMMFDIEKENAMTVAAALRMIPKKTDEAKNPLLDILSDM